MPSRLRIWRSLACLIGLLGAALALAAPSQGAEIISPSEGEVVATRTPTVVIQLDVSLQPDGQPTESRPSLAIYGRTQDGSIKAVTFCEAAPTAQAGQFACSDPQRPLADGIYFARGLVSAHTCFQLPPIGDVQIPPSCSFFTGQPVGGLFRIYVAPPPPPAPPKPEPTPAPPTDLRAPVVRAIGVSGKLGRPVRLLFRVRDNSGRATIGLVVYGGRKALARRVFRNQPVESSKTYYLTWLSPIRGTFSFCVIGSDMADNVSRASCARVTVQ